MSRATLTLAKAELGSLLGATVPDAQGTPTVDGVNVVYDFLPRRDMLTEAVSICVFTDTIGAEFWNIGVSVFVRMTDDERTAQALLDGILADIDHVTNTGGYGPTVWQIVFPETKTNLEHYIATCVYQVGREDI